MFPFPIAVLAGVVLGVASGLTPGLHVNTFALMLLGVSPALLAAGVPASGVAVVIVSSTVSHTFLDIVPSVYLGAPDESMTLGALPGHRMLMSGRGREAIRLSALGSATAIVVAVLFLVPVAILFTRVYPVLQDYMAPVLALVVIIMVLSEQGDFPDLRDRLRVWALALIVFLVSGLLGVAVLDVGEWVFFPLFTGLFGAPVLLQSLGRRACPPLQEGVDELGSRGLGRSAVVGSLAGCLVAWLPGVSSGVATVLARLGLPGDDREYIMSLSSVNTSNAVYCLVALAAIGKSRSGAMSALSELMRVSWDNVSLLLVAMVLAAIPAYLLTVYVGEWAAERVSRVDYGSLCLVVLLCLLGLILVLTGWGGFLVFLGALPVGLLPPLLGVRRSHLMGVLLLPLILYFL